MSEVKNYVPLKFWFNEGRNFHLVVDSFPGIEEIRKNLDNLDNLSYDELVELKNKLFDIQDEYFKTNPRLTPLDPIPLGKDIKEVNDLIDKLGHSHFTKELVIKKSEMVNGYHLYDTDKLIMPYDGFADLVKKWNTNKQYSFDEFYEKCDELACTEWNKMNREGEYFTGKIYDSDEYYDAWDLTRKDNFLALWELPYPKEVILETIIIGCRNLKECVRYSNFICEWIKRKMEQIK